MWPWKLTIQGSDWCIQKSGKRSQNKKDSQQNKINVKNPVKTQFVRKSKHNIVDYFDWVNTRKESQITFQTESLQTENKYHVEEAFEVLLTSCVMNNKPGTAKVGAIFKAQNCERGDPLGFVKLQLVAKNDKKLKGDPWESFKISQKKLKWDVWAVSQCRKM